MTHCRGLRIILQVQTFIKMNKIKPWMSDGFPSAELSLCMTHFYLHLCLSDGIRYFKWLNDVFYLCLILCFYMFSYCLVLLEIHFVIFLSCELFFERFYRQLKILQKSSLSVYCAYWSYQIRLLSQYQWR